MPLNTTYMTKRELAEVDTQLYTALRPQLIGRSLFQATTKTKNQWAPYKTYKVITTNGKAVKYTNGMSNIPTGDMNITENVAWITSSTYGVSYTIEELEEAREGGFDLLKYKTEDAARALAEREDQLIFKGETVEDKKSNMVKTIYGLTSNAKDAGFQSEDAPDNLADIEPIKFANWIDEMIDKIKLNGYENKKPILVLPRHYDHLLNRIYNDYNPNTTIYTMIQDKLADIKFTDALNADYIGDKAKDMGLLMFNDQDTAELLDAMPVRRMQPEYSNMTTRIPYLQRFGGVMYRRPQAIMQLHNIAPKAGKKNGQ